MKRIGTFFIWLLAFLPLSWYFAFIAHNSVLSFVTAIIGLIPLARIIGFATEQLVMQTNPTMGGLAMATFGNAIELIISVFALSSGLIRVVQASIIGSIIGNILLLIGLSVLVGGIKFKEQHFNQASIGVSSTMLIIAVTGLALPSVYFLVTGGTRVQLLSDVVAVVLAITYILGLIFSLKTHKQLFDTSDELVATKEKASIKLSTSLLLLFGATMFAILQSDILVKGVEGAATAIGITQTFIGIVIIAVVTNIAEKASAINFALKNKIDISLEIGLSSAIQIALFVVPLLVLISELFHFGFNLIFSLFEVVSLIFAVMIVNYLSSDGKTNWMEGVQLIAVYLIIVTAFFFIP